MSDDKPKYVKYRAGNPVVTGVYACRVPDDEICGYFDDLFLMWLDGKWGYLGSDQKYRGEVVGWIGPLARRDFIKE